MKLKYILKASALVSAAFGALLTFAPTANAVTLDFVAEAAGNERAVADGTVINFGGLNVTFSSSHFAYFDDLSGGPGGLGVCPSFPSLNCGSADNIQTGEDVTLIFPQAVTFSGLTFTDGGHNPVLAMETLLIGLNGGGLLSTTFGAAVAAIFQNVTSITFGHGGINPSDYYVNGATAVIPLPAALPLFGTGLGILGFLGWRRRRQAQAV